MFGTWDDVMVEERVVLMLGVSSPYVETSESLHLVSK